MKHNMRLAGALYCVASLFACATITAPPDCPAADVKPPKEDFHATHTPQRHFALGYRGDEKFPAGVVKAFSASPWSNTRALNAVDLREQLAPDDDQTKYGRCTGFGLAHGCYAALYKAGVKNLFFSPNFIYWNERKNLGTITQDSGARIGADGIFTLKTTGACLLNTWPNCQDIFTQPPSAAFKEGLDHLVLQAYNVDNRNGDEIERAMSAGFVVVYGITLHAEFENLNATNFVYHGKGAVIGGHCMEMFKYDKATGLFDSRNQWGKDKWGRADEFQMPASIVHSGAVNDCYVIYAMKVPAKPKARFSLKRHA
jgi:hypothetical protein